MYPERTRSRADGLRLAERAHELHARADVELPIDARQMRLDGLLGHEQRLGDLAIRHAVGRHARDPQLVRRELVALLRAGMARLLARRGELLLRPPGEHRRAGTQGELLALAQRLARLAAAPLPSQRSAQFDERAREVEARARAAEHGDRRFQL